MERLSEKRDSMFIHIGNDHVVRTRDIIMMIDYHQLQTTSTLKESLKHWQENQQVIGSMDTAKTIIITTDYVYLSSLSIATLKKRSSITSMLNKVDQVTIMEHDD